jgi:hypothetical protein
MTSSKVDRRRLAGGKHRVCVPAALQLGAQA